MKPLDDIRVLDLTRVVSGPFCTMQLGDMGADVLKVEETLRGDDSRAFGPPFQSGEAAYYLSVNRSKRSIALNLKRPEARPILEALVKRSDVIVENFRPGVADRLGLDYRTVASWNRRIVYCSISGFGTSGPERDRSGYDLVVQGACGIMDITGDPAGPPTKIGTSVADLVTGLYAAQAIVLALRARERTGEGQKVEIAMIDAMASLLTFNAAIYYASGRSPRRRGNTHATIVPYETFKASDGWLNIAVANDALWIKFCAATGLEHLRDDPRFREASARVQNRDALLPIINECIVQRGRADWVAALDAAGVPCGEIRTVAEVCDNPALLSRGMIRDIPHETIGHVRMFDTPMRFSATPGGAETAAPTLGRHTRAILTELVGLSRDEIDRLDAEGVIRCG